MKRALFALLALGTWALVLSAASVVAGSPGDQADVQIREYRDGWGVMVTATQLGQEPAVLTFEIDPTPTHDHHRVGPWEVDVEWGAGPNGAPLVTVQPIKESVK